MKPLRKAVVTAAGWGTRFLPATKAQPKEMLPLVDKPIIQYVIEEAVAAGLTNIIIVTGRGKNAIEDHFDVSYELEKLLLERGKTELLEQVRAVSPTPSTRRGTSAATSPSWYCSATRSLPHLPQAPPFQGNRPPASS